MRSFLVHRLLIWISRKLNIAPILAHILVLLVITFLFGALNPDGFSLFTNQLGLMIWVGICVVVILVTWLSKGAARSDWLKSEPWKE